jgi:hypothetical protein
MVARENDVVARENDMVARENDWDVVARVCKYVVARVIMALILHSRQQFYTKKN